MYLFFLFTLNNILFEDHSFCLNPSCFILFFSFLNMIIFVYFKFQLFNEILNILIYVNLKLILFILNEFKFSFSSLS
jgi:hypothetical protein